MRVKYEVFRDGNQLIATAVVWLNKRERKRLTELLQDEGEITLCFWTTLTLSQIENPLVIEQVAEFEPGEDCDERRELSNLLDMVADEVADLCCLLKYGKTRMELLFENAQRRCLRCLRK